jgi:hypothetical protein
MFNVQIYYRSVTPVLGAVSFDTSHLHGELLSVHVKPLTSTTTYKVKVIGKNGIILWESVQDGVGETGEISQTVMNRLVNEILTIEVSSASVNEAFDVVLRIKGYKLGR